jgi:hypothetical protein
MTDSSSLLANTTALSNDVLYNLKPSSVRCRQYRCSVPTSNKSTFTASDVAIAYIPCRRNCFLDVTQSYLRYTVKNMDAANALTIDGTAASFINRIDIFHGSNMLESIQNYDVLTAYLADFQLNTAQRAGLEASWGCKSDRSGDSIAAAASQTFAMPIFSGVCGVLADKFLPMSLADDIRLEFTFNTAALAARWATAVGTYNITNFELELTVLELSDEGMRLVESVTPFTEPIYMHGSSFKHFSSSLATASVGQQSFLVPARFASLKSLVLCPRRSTEIIDALSFSIASRVNPNIETYNWRIGSLIVPQKTVTLKNANTTGGYAEGYTEILRSFHSLSSASASSSLSYDYYNVANTVDATGRVIVPNTGANSYKNGFAIAQELESFANRGDILLSGTNTLNLQVFFEYTNNTAVTDSYTLDFFGMYDHILILDENGLLSVKF